LIARHGETGDEGGGFYRRPSQASTCTTRDARSDTSRDASKARSLRRKGWASRRYRRFAPPDAPSASSSPEGICARAGHAPLSRARADGSRGRSMPRFALAGHPRRRS